MTFSRSRAVAIIYVVVARLSLTLASVNASASPIWPTTGFALAAVLLLGYRVIPRSSWARSSSTQ